MSKSLGNMVFVRDALETTTPQALRLYLFDVHYRRRFDHHETRLERARGRAAALAATLGRGPVGPLGRDASTRAVLAALDDDLDTPRAIALAWELIKDDRYSSANKAATLRHLDTVLGLGLSDAPDSTSQSLGVIEASDLPDEVQKLLQEREKARNRKNWDEADSLREAINLKGYLVEDTPHGVRVTKV